MRRLLTMVLGLALLTAACGDSFDCSIVQCEGLYQAPGEEGFTEFLRFWADGTVVWVPVQEVTDENDEIIPVTPDAVAEWLDEEYEQYAGGRYSIDGSELKFSLSGFFPNRFEGQVENGTLSLTRTDQQTGERFERTFTFVPVTFPEE